VSGMMKHVGEPGAKWTTLIWQTISYENVRRRQIDICSPFTKD